jgi:hypothetical protein
MHLGTIPLCLQKHLKSHRKESDLFKDLGSLHEYGTIAFRRINQYLNRLGQKAHVGSDNRYVGGNGHEETREFP